ncbi:MAG: aldo/keto reductase [Clostridiales bacterium]|nr:aldo/keto reductase [Clostridiales bacterium]MCF8021120.1 aldo/keto reductase [Clostridiales bacterium]
MYYRELGTTGMKVSRLCFGSLTVGPLQSCLPVREGSAVIRSALEKGVNFIDTSHFYNNYAYIKEAIRDGFQDTIITSKSYDYTYRGMESTFYECLNSLGRDYIDIFLLHEQESALTIKGHWDAVEFLISAREKGLVRAIGISTHSVEGVKAAALIPEMEIIHPLINKAGIGIQKGTVNDMLETISFAYSLGKGLYGMKALGGGNLIADSSAALKYVNEINELSSIAVGMQSHEEVLYNTAFFSGEQVPREIEEKILNRNRRLLIEDWCTGCGECVQRCSSGALSVVNGKAQVDPELCCLCGYCGAVCPELCIKII